MRGWTPDHTELMTRSSVLLRLAIDRYLVGDLTLQAAGRRVAGHLRPLLAQAKTGERRCP